MPEFRKLFSSLQTALLALTEIFLLVGGFFGIHRGARDIFIENAEYAADDLFYLLVLGALPLVLFVALAALEAMRRGKLKTSEGFLHRIGELQRRMNEQDDFFQMVNSSTSSTLLVYNDKNEYWFVNKCAARKIGKPESEIIGKKITDVLGYERGNRIIRCLDSVRQTGESLEVIDQESRDGHIAYIQTTYRPLKRFGKFPGDGVMANGEDVTTIMVSRERRETMLQQIISTLVAVVDRRDPYAAGHSTQVGKLARAMATELRLSDRDVEAAEIAGLLMNFGKVLISRSILTKTGALSPDELQRVRDCILTSADILSRIDFDVPVVPTLRQVLERFDGTGTPKGLRGDEILITAQIVAVANAFVACVSPRAHRPGSNFFTAMKFIIQESGKAYDPRVTTALEKVLSRDAAKFEWLAGKGRG